ncbi:MAG TPA: O-antigen ligase family protein [Patescibacteria group bacterium]
MKNIEKYGLYIFLFLLPWQTRWIFHLGWINGNTNEYLTKSLYLSDVVLVGLLILVFLNEKKFFSGAKKIFVSIRGKIFSLFLLWCLVSLFWAENMSLALQRVFWIALATLLAMLIIRIKNNYEFFYALILSLMLSAWLGVWQFLFRQAFANKWLGLAAHDVSSGGTSYLEISGDGNQAVRWLRAYGSFDHPNIFGVATAVGLLLSFWIYACKKNKQKREEIFLLFATASFALGIFSSLSRSALLGLLLGLLVIFFKEGFVKIRKPLRISAAMFAIMLVLYPAPYVARSNVDSRLERKSLDERKVYFEQGKNMIEKNMMLGVGMGNYVQELTREDPTKEAWSYQPIHNFFLLVWAELGIFGMLALAALLLFICLKAWKGNGFGAAMLAVLLPAAFFDHWLWDLHFGVLLLGLIVGIILTNRGEQSLCA